MKNGVLSKKDRRVLARLRAELDLDPRADLEAILRAVEGLICDVYDGYELAEMAAEDHER